MSSQSHTSRYVTALSNAFSEDDEILIFSIFVAIVACVVGIILGLVKSSWLWFFMSLALTPITIFTIPFLLFLYFDIMKLIYLFLRGRNPYF